MLAIAASTRSSEMACLRTWASSRAGRGDMALSRRLGVGVDPLVEELLRVEAGQIGAQELKQLGGVLDVHVPVEHHLTVVDRHNFDAVGAWRTAENGTPIDSSGMLVDGSKLDGVKGLREALLRYSPQFVRVVTENLFIYALGRGTEYYDMPLIRSIVRDSESNNYRFSSIVLGIVKSEPFQVNQKQEITSNARGSEVAGR